MNTPRLNRWMKQLAAGLNGRVAACALATMLAACGTTPSSIIQQPSTSLPLPPQEYKAASNGSIYQVATYRPMFEDRRARLIGDVLTITINEKSSAGSTGSSSASKSGAVDALVSATAGLPLLSTLLDKFQDANVVSENSGEYADKSALSSGNTFNASISVTVTNVLSNGNLVVSGEKQIALDKGVEFIRFSGVVNPDDIQLGNIVSSTKVADARLEYRTTAKYDAAELTSWLARFFYSFLPL
ncbi:flagellar basal body L-ring protein FlgH [Thiobacillus sp.]|uniref:flagellar basal body L-ring protein FlgH n=1 Tax=Thiobacillus sp. TaxID=924 RepID=UPI0025DFC15F|nr:flagellar basal body L-ring protein FlgH [Thiobacillus sp.]